MPRAAALVVATLLVGCAEPRAEPTTVMPDICMDNATSNKVRAISLDALDAALKNHIEHTFEIWMRDTSRQPERARNGVMRGIAAYLRARDDATRWSPRQC